MDEGLLYDKSEINFQDFANAEWENLDDFLFDDLLEFDNEKAETNTILALIALGRKSIELLESGIERNDIRSRDQEETQPLDDNFSDIKSALILVPDPINSLPRQSISNRIEQVLYPSQIIYSSEPTGKLRQ